MKIFNFTFPFILFCLPMALAGQNFDRIDIPVYQNNKQLLLPFTGGLKAGQFSNIDLNQDGIKDLFVFDRNGDQVLPFIKIGLPGSLEYRFAPEYISVFPEMRNWALLVDFNQDGVEDIFCSSGVYPGSMEAWKGNRDSNGRLTFKRLTFNYGIPEILQFPISNGYTQIYVSSIDLPAVADADGDGDMDIISFEADGSFASFYKNVSVEENLGIDSLKYVRADICWGKFAENQFNEDINLSSDAFSCASGFTGGGNSGVRHSGSSLTLFDSDGDGDMDLVIGDLASSKLKRLFNGGTKQTAHMTSLETNFPAEDIAVDLDVFLAAYYVDVDGDNKRDLIVTPNDINSGESENHVWLYKNIGSDAAPTFKFIKDDFLIDEMLFFNGGSHPVFADVNGDGLQDMVVGTNGILQKGGSKKYRMILLLNNGTETAPLYVVEDEDYLSFSQYGEFTGRFAPTFGDMDDDGDEDLMVGDARGLLYLAINIAGKDKPMTFEPPVYLYADISAGQNAKPQIIDLDDDGLKDLLIGEKNNQLNFFKNIGTTGMPKFSPEPSIFPNTDQAGKIFTSNDFPTQNGAPFLIRSQGKLIMLMGTEDADILAYDQIEGHIYGTFNVLYSKTGNINQGRKVTVALDDIDEDGYFEMAVGNERGGIVFYNTIFKTDSISSVGEPEHYTQNIELYPNPAFTSLYIKTNHDNISLSLESIMGNHIMKLSGNQVNQLPSLPAGLYLVKATSTSQINTYKLIITGD
ncbi:MAG: T9SS type A sorting domain-containing protein [Saprospiraceae bacterium]